MKIVVAVGIASHPISAAGNTWNSLNWALGFRELGWDVWIVEAVKSTGCIDGNWKPASFEQSANLAYWREITAKFDLTERATLLVDGNAPQARKVHARHGLLDVVQDHSAADAYRALPRGGLRRRRAWP